MNHPTPDLELNAVLRELVTSVQAILGDTFIGAYLQGSFALGGWEERPNPSLKVRQQADPGDLERTLDFIRYALDVSGH